MTTFLLCINVLYFVFSDGGITTDVEVINSGSYQIRPGTLTTFALYHFI